MGSVSAIAISSFRLANIYQINNARLNVAQQHVSTGKRINSPKDGASDLFQANSFATDVRSLSNVRNNLVYGIGLLKSADLTGENILDNLIQMRNSLSSYYQDTTDIDTTTAAQAMFLKYKSNVINAVANSYFEEHRLVSDNGGNPFVRISLDPRDISSTFDIEFSSSEIPDASALTLGVTNQAAESAALEAEIARAGNYLAKISAQLRGLESQMNLVDLKTVEYNKTIENRIAGNEGEMMMQMTKRSIQQQMAISMIAQATDMRKNMVMQLTKNF
jgi:flagellin-like hook-associated protein FlgL